MSGLDVLLHCNSGASACVTHDIEALATDEGSESVEYRGVRDYSDVDESEIVRRESHLWKRIYALLVTIVAPLLFPGECPRLRPLLVDVDESSVPLPVVRLCDRVTGFLNKSAKTASMPYVCVRSDDDDELHAF